MARPSSDEQSARDRVNAPDVLCGGLYDYPAYCDLLFRERTRGEVRFLMRCWRRHARREIRRVLEAACGSGRVLLRLARAGFDVAGIDRSVPSVQYCNARFERHRFPAPARVANLEDFGVDAPVDAVVCVLNGFRHLETQYDVLRHFEAVGRALAPGGVYVVGLELTPPGAWYPTPWRTLARSGPLTLVTDLLTRTVDPVRRCETRHVVVNIHTPTRWRRVEDTLRLRTYSADQFLRLATQLADLQLVEAADLMRLTRPVACLGEETEDAAFVFVRR